MPYGGTGIGTGSLMVGGAGLATEQAPLLVVAAAMLIAAVVMVVRRIRRTAADQRP